MRVTSIRLGVLGFAAVLALSPFGATPTKACTDHYAYYYSDSRVVVYDSVPYCGGSGPGCLETGCGAQGGYCVQDGRIGICYRDV